MTYLLLTTALIIAYFKIPPHWAILVGVIISLFLPQSDVIAKNGKKWSSNLLQLSVVLLGAGLNFYSVLHEGMNGMLITFISIGSVFILGYFLSRLFKVEKTLATLITTGTSICGGSAISAVSAVIKPSSLTMATALGIVFILNAISVFVLPPIGHWLELSQSQFGAWSALAIHDTSSVVAAAQIYGEEALKIGTTLKLTRALWIIPLSLIFAWKNKSQKVITPPWFILYFLMVSLTFTFFEDVRFLIPYFSSISKIGLSLTLFLIGLGLNKAQIKSIGLSPIAFGVSLWLVTLFGTLTYIKYFA